MMFGGRAVAFVNARVLTPVGTVSTIRTMSRVLDTGAAPQRGDQVVDLDGAFVLPGLINAHDHLELNHFGSLKGRDRYQHANDWIDDLRPRLQADPEIRRNARFPLSDRLFVGGLKNLLAGVTTVAHHNPRYAAIGRDFPVRVLARYGWAHSFAMEHEPVGARGEPGGVVADRCEATPPTQPFLVHVGEGVDDRAAFELLRFADTGCLRPNSVIVHGVAHTVDSWRRSTAAGTALVWCPTSNAFLLGKTLPLAALFAAVPESARLVCLGSDSRLTGGRDLLDEAREAAASLPGRKGVVLPMVTATAADVLRMDSGGRLVPGAPADLMVIPPDPLAPEDAERALLAASRHDVRFVMIGGRPMVGDLATRPAFVARRIRTAGLRIDDAPRLADAALVRRIVRCAIPEPGVELAP